MTPAATSLDRLHEVIAPAPVPWWPPAPGWYGLIGLALFLTVIGLIRFIVWWQANAYRREARRELESHVPALHDLAQRPVALAHLALLLKRVALTAYPREQVASLTGPAWLRFLDETGKTSSFSQAPGSCLGKIAYDSRCADQLTEAEVGQIVALVRHWIRHHQVAANLQPSAAPTATSEVAC